MKNLPKARTKNILEQKNYNETLIYDLSSNKAFCLNHTSELVWQLCDGTRTTAVIKIEIEKVLKTEVTEDYIYLAIQQLYENELLEDEIELESEISNLSRRKLIKKVGFASMVALPIISTVIAPQATSAQSCLGLRSTCDFNSDCCSNNCITADRTCCVSGATGSLLGTFCVPDAPSCNAFQSSCCANTITPDPSTPCIDSLGTPGIECTCGVVI